MGWHITSDRSWVAPWVADQIAGTFCIEHIGAIGLSPDGLQLVAGVVYEDWNGKSIVAHIAVAGRMTPAFLAAIFDYPFNICGAHKVMCPIPSNNPRSIRLATNMGFREEARIKDAQPCGDILIYTLIKPDCRFLEERYGKKQTSSPAHA